MTQEEIRKLLGGYATDTLTERERTALFEAALDDQDLFNALQNEDALRELLADPVSHEQIRQALKPAPRRPFWSQPWLIKGLIGAASVAVAAVIAIVIVTSHREPAATSLPQQLAQTQSEPKLEIPALPPVLPPPEQRRASPQVLRSSKLAAPRAAGLSLPEGVADGPLYSGPLVHYSVVRSGPSGDSVRIEVVSQRAGSLSLYQADAAGQWQRVYPANGPALPIAASTSYQIPDDPIAMRGNARRLRVVIEPSPTPAPLAQATGTLMAPRAQTFEKKEPAPTRLVIEIPIGPN
jgi:hypothetical protein